MKRTLLRLASFGALLLASSLASAQPFTCAKNTNWQETGDAYYYPKWNCSADIIAKYWAWYHMRDVDWNEGFGYEAPCDLNRPLARTFNALYVLHNSDPNPVTALSYVGKSLKWSGAYASTNISRLNPSCADTAFATTWSEAWQVHHTELYKPFFFDETISQRAATIFHEARHAEAGKSHTDGCLDGPGSCDPSWDWAGANRWSVTWLRDYAEGAYNATILERTHARDDANTRIIRRFETPPPIYVEVFPDVPLVGDLNKDGIADIVLFRQDDPAYGGQGVWYGLSGAALENNSRVGVLGPKMYGFRTDIPLLADMDNDGADDLVIYRTGERTWHAWSAYKNAEIFRDVYVPDSSGGDNPVPMIGDVNGDGTKDLVMFNRSNGYWRAMSGFGLGSGLRTMLVTGRNFGEMAGDVPVLGNFDADAGSFSDDFGIFRTFDGTWHAFSPQLNAGLSWPGGLQWGENGDVPLVADFDGDGRRDDIGIYRPRTGEWFAHRPSGDIFGPFQYGAPRDVPLLGNFNSDKAADLVIFRPYEGTWHVANRVNATSLLANQQFGQVWP